MWVRKYCSSSPYFAIISGEPDLILLTYYNTIASEECRHLKECAYIGSTFSI